MAPSSLRAITHSVANPIVAEDSFTLCKLAHPKGAAEKLGLKRTTLIAKMRRLGITRPELRHDVALVRTAVRGAAVPDGGSRDLAADKGVE